MKKLNLVALLLSMTLLFGMSQTASADDEVCESKGAAINHVDTVDDLIYNAEFYSRDPERDRDRLRMKTLAAIEKLEAYKLDNAIDKMEDLYYKVDALDSAPKAKINSDDASAINAAVIHAVECIGELT